MNQFPPGDLKFLRKLWIYSKLKVDRRCQRHRDKWKKIWDMKFFFLCCEILWGYCLHSTIDFLLYVLFIAVFVVAGDKLSPVSLLAAISYRSWRYFLRSINHRCHGNRWKSGTRLNHLCQGPSQVTGDTTEQLIACDFVVYQNSMAGVLVKVTVKAPRIVFTIANVVLLGGGSPSSLPAIWWGPQRKSYGRGMNR